MINKRWFQGGLAFVATAVAVLGIGSFLLRDDESAARADLVVSPPPTVQPPVTTPAVDPGDTADADYESIDSGAEELVVDEVAGGDDEGADDGAVGENSADSGRVEDGAPVSAPPGATSNGVIRTADGRATIWDYSVPMALDATLDYYLVLFVDAGWELQGTYLVGDPEGEHRLSMVAGKGTEVAAVSISADGHAGDSGRSWVKLQVETRF